MADGGLYEAVMKAASSVSRATSRVYDDGEARWSKIAAMEVQKNTKTWERVQVGLGGFDALEHSPGIDRHLNSQCGVCY